FTILLVLYFIFFFFLMFLRPSRSTLFPYTTLFRSGGASDAGASATPGRLHAAGTDDRPGDFGAAAQRPVRGGRHATEPDERHVRSEEHTSELQSRGHLVCRLLLEKKKKKRKNLIEN